ADGALIREEQRARELLRQRRGALAGFALTDVVTQRARESQRVDARVLVEPSVLRGDERVLQLGRDRVERDVTAVLVESEPGLAVRAEEGHVADAAGKLVDGERVPAYPDERRDLRREDARSDEEHR